MNPTTANMGEGKVLNALIKLGGPAMVSMFFQNLYALVDTVFVSWIGTNQLAALSLCVPMLYVSLSLGKGISVGTTALMSQARGAQDVASAGKVARAALPLALMVLCPFCLFAFPEINQPLFRLFGVNGEVLVEVDRFVFWLAWTFPVMGFAMICEGIFLSYGDSKTPMKAMITGNLLNLLLDPFLIFTCKLGIAGASLASLIGWAVAGGIMFFTLRRRRMDIPQVVCHKAHLGYWGKIVKLGGPVALSMLVLPLSLAGLNSVLAPFGPAFVGAWNLSARMEQMLILPLYGLSCSLIPFAGFNLGRGDAGRIREATRISVMACYTVLIPAGIMLAIYAREIIGIFRPGPEVLELSSFAYRAALAGYWFGPLELIMMGLAQGINRSGFTLLVNSMRVLLLRIPLAVLFGHLWGGKGAYISHPVSLTITGIFSLFVIRHLLRSVEEQCAARQLDRQKRDARIGIGDGVAA